jgi:hypothetical protein
MNQIIVLMYHLMHNNIVFVSKILHQLYNQYLLFLDMIVLIDVLVNLVNNLMMIDFHIVDFEIQLVFYYDHLNLLDVYLFYVKLMLLDE